jgi:hypothetical protein
MIYEYATSNIVIELTLRIAIPEVVAFGLLDENHIRVSLRVC